MSARLIACLVATLPRPNHRYLVSRSAIDATLQSRFSFLALLVLLAILAIRIAPWLVPNGMPQRADFKKLGVGISVVWVRALGSSLNTAKYELISDVVLVSVVPAVSIQVDFEETPRTEIELGLRRHLSANDVVKCGRIKSPRE